MATEIDNRIVQMELKNKNFESNANETMNTLDRLKEKLNLGNVAKSFQDLDIASNKISFAGIGGAIESISSRFTNLGIIGITALQNIANSAINTGKTMLKALTIDPISQGFSEYELKTGSIQTIMAGTGESLETVSAKLDELNTYSDKTIYNFADMTRNIGTFTNAGVKLNDAVAAIQGIANEAALSGASAQQASHAMYNFAQALSSGYVKLIDWKSIEIANMATVEFKEQLLETAVALGTVVKEGNLYRTTTTNAKGEVSDLFDSTKNFNDSLQHQWMTTEVLTQTLAKYADETTDVGKKATKAATELKTFSMLMDSLKEAVGSGWARTWETIFGDFEEAKELWTRINNVVSGVIDKQSDSRNTFLAEWKELGGRTAIIEGLANSFKYLGDLLEPIEESFKTVFPPTTAKQFADASDLFYKLTERLNVSDNTAKNIKDTFGGLFSILSIGVNVLGSAFKIGSKIGMYLIPRASKGLLSVTGYIGRFFTAVNKSFKSVDFFGKIFTKFESVLGSIATKIGDAFAIISESFDLLQVFDTKNFEDFLLSLSDNIVSGLDNIQNGIESFSGIDLNGFKTFVSKTIDIFHPFQTTISVLGTVFGWFGSIFSKIYDKLSPILKSMGEEFQRVGGEIFDAIINMDFNKALNLLNTGLFGAILINVRKLFKSFKKTKDDTKGLFDGIKDIFEDLSNTLQAFQHSIRVDSLIKIALAVGILAASLLLLTGIDEDSLINGLTGLTWILAELAIANNIINVTSSGGSKGIVSLSAAIFIMSKSLLSISKIEPDRLNNSVLALAESVGVLTVSAMLLSKSGSISKASKALINISIALTILSVSLKLISSIPSMQILSGLSAIIISLTALTLLTRLLEKSNKQINKSAASMIKLAAAMSILVIPIRTIASMELENVIKSVGAVLVLATGLSAVTRIFRKDGSAVNKAANALIKIAVATSILLIPLKVISGMDQDKIINGVGAIVVLVNGIAVASRLASGNEKKIHAIGSELTLMAVGLSVLTPLFKTMAELPIDSFLGAIIGLTGFMAAMAVISNFFSSDSKKITSFGKGMILVSFGLSLLTKPLERLSSIPMETLGVEMALMIGFIAGIAVSLRAFSKSTKNILTAAFALINLGLAFNLMALPLKMLSSIPIIPLITGIVALPTLIALLGLSIRAFPKAAKVASFAASLISMSVAFTIFSGATLLMIPAILSMAAASKTDILSALGMTVSVFLSLALATKLLAKQSKSMLKIATSFALIGMAATALVMFATIIQSSSDDISKSIEIVVKSAISAITNSAGAIIDGLLYLIEIVLDSLADRTPVIVDNLARLIIGILESLDKYIPQIVQVGVRVISNLFMSLAEACNFTDSSAKNLLLGVVIITALGFMFDKLANIKKTAKNGILGAVAVSAAIGIVGAVLIGLSALGQNIDMSQILLLSSSISMVTVSMSLIFGFLAKAGQQAVKGILGAVAVAAAIGIIGSVLVGIAALANLTDLSSLPTLLGAAVASIIPISLTMALLSLLPIPAALGAVAGLAIFAVGFTGVLLLLGGIGQIPGVKWLLEEGIFVFGKLGEAIGTFIGSIIEGIAEHVINIIPKFGSALSQFGVSFQSFCAAVSSIPENALQSVGILCGVILALTAAEILDAVAGWLTGGASMSNFVEMLNDLAPAIVSFSKNLHGLENPSNLEAAANAAKMLAEFAQAAPKEGGLVQMVTGSADLKKFADGLSEMAPSLVKFSEECAGIKRENVEAGVNAGKIIGGFIDGFGGLKTGGLVQFWEGTVDYQHFSAWLPMMGTAIKNFGDNVNGLKSDAVTKGAEAGKTISGFIDNFESLKTGGIAQWWNGTTNYDDFIDNVPRMGAAIKDFGDATDGLSVSNVAAAAAAGQMITELQKSLPTETNAFWGLFEAKKQSLDDFANGITSLATSLGVYSAYANGMDINKVRVANAIVVTLTDLVKVLNGNDGGTLVTFSKHLSAAGDLGVSKFVSGFTNSYTDLKNAVVSFLTAIDDAIKETKPTVDKNADNFVGGILGIFNSYSEKFKMAATSNISSYNEGVSSSYSDVRFSYDDIIKRVISSLTSEESALPVMFKNMGILTIAWIRNGVSYAEQSLKDQVETILSDIVETVETWNTKVEVSGRQFALGFSAGVKDKENNVFEAVSDLANGSHTLLQRELKIHSPSALTYNDGLNYDRGLANGIVDGSGMVAKAHSNMLSSQKSAHDYYLDGQKIGASMANGVSEGVKNSSYSDWNDELFGISDDSSQKSAHDYYLDGQKIGASMANGVSEGVKNSSNVVDESFESIVNAVIRGEWGNGLERIQRITEANLGYTYEQIQDRVNEIWYNIPKVVDDSASLVSESVSESIEEELSMGVSDAIETGVLDGVSSIDMSDYSLDISDLGIEGLSDLNIPENELSNMLSSLSFVDDFDLQSELDSNDYETDVTLNPVWDLTDFQNGIDYNSMISPEDYYNLSSSLGDGTTANLAYDFASTAADYSEIINEIELVRSDLSKFTTKVTDMVVILDDGTLVGKILPKIDAGLGARATNSKRGN